MIMSNAKRVAMALLLVGALWGCSKAPAPARDETESARASTSGGKPTVQPENKPIAVPTPDKGQKSIEEVSRVVGKADVAVRGRPSCRIDFVYVGYDPEDLLLDAPCEAVRAKMMDQSELEGSGKWQRLDEFEKRHVNQLPGGMVLYVEEQGGDENAKASIYPVGTTRLSYEVSVAD